MALERDAESSPLFFFAFVMLTEPLTAPTMRWPRDRLRRARRLPVRAQRPHRLVLLHARTGAARRQSLRLCGQPQGPLRADAGAHRAGGRRHLRLHLPTAAQARLRRPASISNGRLAWIAPTIAATGATSPRLGADRGVGPPRRQVLSEAERLQARARPRWRPGDTIHASQLAGSFTLPADPDRKLAFLAGGIGITPFRSMLQYLLDRGEARPIVVLYGNETRGGHRLSRRARRGRAASSASGRSMPSPTAPRRGQYPGFIDARLMRDGDPRLPRAHLLHLRPAGDGAGPPPYADADGRPPLAHQGRLLPGLRLTATAVSVRPARGSEDRRPSGPGSASVIVSRPP